VLPISERILKVVRPQLNGLDQENWISLTSNFGSAGGYRSLVAMNKPLSPATSGEVENRLRTGTRNHLANVAGIDKIPLAVPKNLSRTPVETKPREQD